MCPEFLNGKKTQNFAVYSPTSLLGTSFQLFLLCLSSLKSLSCYFSAGLLHRCILCDSRGWGSKGVRQGSLVSPTHQTWPQPGICRPGSGNPKGCTVRRAASPDAGQCCSPSFCCVMGCWPLAYVSLMDVAGWLVRSLHRPWGLKTTLDQGCSWP